MEGKGDQWRDGQINLRNSIGMRRELVINHWKRWWSRW